MQFKRKCENQSGIIQQLKKYLTGSNQKFEALAVIIQHFLSEVKLFYFSWVLIIAFPRILCFLKKKKNLHMSSWISVFKNLNSGWGTIFVEKPRSIAEQFLKKTVVWCPLYINNAWTGIWQHWLNSESWIFKFPEKRFWYSSFGKVLSFGFILCSVCVLCSFCA